MGTRKFTRRQAITTASAGMIGTMINWPLNEFIIGKTSREKLAILGGKKVHQGEWMEWPVWDDKAEKGILEMLRTGRWW